MNVVDYRNVYSIKFLLSINSPTLIYEATAQAFAGNSQH